MSIAKLVTVADQQSADVVAFLEARLAQAKTGKYIGCVLVLESEGNNLVTVHATGCPNVCTRIGYLHLAINDCMRRASV